MKRNWLAIAALSIGLSADALVLTSLLWVVLKAASSGQALALAAFFAALVPLVIHRYSKSTTHFIAKNPGRAYLGARLSAFALAIACALTLDANIPSVALYALIGAFSLLSYLTHQSLEGLFAYRVFARELSPSTAARVLQTSIQVGALVGAATAGFILDAGGFRAVAVILASLFAFGALTSDLVASIKDEGKTQDSSDGLLDLPKDAESPAVWGAFVMIGLVLINVWAFGVLVPYIVGIERLWSAREFGIIDASAGAGTLLAAALLGGRLSNIAWLGFAGLAVSDLWLATAPTLLQSALAAAGAGFFGGSIRVQQRELLFRAVSSPAQATRWASKLSTITFLCRTLTPLALAGVIDRLGGATVLQALALSILGVGFALQLMQVLAVRFRPIRRRPVAVLIDAYSSGALLAPEFIARGYNCVHVMSSAQLAPTFYNSLREEDFTDHLLHQGSLPETLEELRSHRPKLVIAASEPGVELADLLSEHMGVLTNGTRMSAARRNKYLQIEALRARGLRCPNQGLATSVEEGVLVARELGSWPVVLKPLASSSTDLVRLCANEEEVRENMRETLGRKNLYGKYNDEVLVQTFLRGVEYAVDTLSVNGQHRVTGLWRYEKASFDRAPFTYRQIDLLDLETNLARELVDYAFSVLEVLEIKSGPTHQEIMLTSEGPALVECNARLCGAGMPALWHSCTGESLPGFVAESLVEQKTFLKRPTPLVQLEKRGRIVFLSSQVDHCILNPAGLKTIQGLESFARLILTRKPEDVYPRSLNLLTVVGQVQLAHPENEVVERDTNILRGLEASGLYFEVSPPREYFDRPFSVRRPQLVRVKAPVELPADRNLV